MTASFLLFYAENDSLDVANVRWLRKNHGVVETSPFQNVFFCFYWGFVTVTTVGYGDYTPASPWGQVIACFTMIIGVFTIVFPTSIISNNFATEWKSFHDAQKLREQRIMHQEYEHKRRDLSRVWQYANQDYKAVPEDSSGGALSIHGDAQSEIIQMTGASQGITSEERHQQLLHRQQRRPGLLFDETVGGTASSADEEAPYPPRSSKLAPFEYNKIMHITEKVEKDLGIPGMALGQVDAGSEVNQNLVVNAMYTKLYNDAYGALCERMLLRIVGQNGLGSVDDVAHFLYSRPSQEHAAKNWPSEKRLTMLEYKLLNFVYEKASLRAGSSIGTSTTAADITKADIHSRVMEHRHLQTSSHWHDGGKHKALGKLPVFGRSSTFSSPNVASTPATRKGSPAKSIRRRLKSKLGQVYDSLPMTRETTHHSVHSYMSSAIANETPRASRRSESSRLNMANNGRQSRPREISRPMPLPRSASEEVVDAHPPRVPLSPTDPNRDQVYERSGSVSSPAIAINVLSSSDDSESESSSN
ncbi:hypothetical protein GGI21_003854 [Coemansia aciculifera]|nr:hypothetical protein GGI21_003854 [Coemansia aciculifera]